MAVYPFDQHTKVALVPSIANWALPTLDELNAGLDITCELTKDGLNLVRTTDSIDRTRWRDLLVGADPGRYSFDQPSLKGQRRTLGDPEPLWDAAAAFRRPAILVVRRGVLYDTPWEGGQHLEIIGFRWGKRSTAASAANTNVTFTVPIFVNADVDDAIILGDALLAQDGTFLTTESGDFLTIEGES